MQMKIFKNQFLFILYFINLIYQTFQQQNIIQSDRVLIKPEQQVWSSTSIGANSYKNYDFDISSGKFKNLPKIVYALTVYNSEDCSKQGFLLTNINLTQAKLSYKLQSLGCKLLQLGFNIIAIDDPNIEVQQKKLSSSIATTITGTQDILQIAAFIYGFEGSNGSNLQLKYTLTKIDNRNYKIQFSNQNVPTVYLNIVIIYQTSSQNMLEQLYSYQAQFDTQGKNIGGDNTVQWKISAQIDSSPVFFGLKDFSISSDGYFGIKILSGQTPEAKNKQVILNYFTWNGYNVNMINGIWMGFTLKTCQSGYTMFLNSTYNACVKSCNSVDHHYNTNPSNTQLLYSTSIILCQQCNQNCYGCKDGYPNICLDCYNNMYLNPFSNTCDSSKPASTFCQVQTVNNQIFQNCQKCDPTCKECSSANNPKSCTSCDLSSSNKYYYQNQCLSSQPASTYCDSNYICQKCNTYCATCSNSSDNCQSCVTNSYLYSNKCLAKICSLNQYLNPYTNNCDQSQPSSTSCTQITLNGSTFYYCQKCDPSCKECSAPESSNSCTLCNINSSNKYFYNNQCQIQQPPATYCDSNFICYQCDLNCSSCSVSSSNCQSCIANKYQYFNQCLDIACKSNEFLNSITKTCDTTKPPGTFCTIVTQNGNSFQYCQKCDSTCQECDSPGDSKSCTSCNVSSSNKYQYKGQCLPTQPPKTFCNLNLECQDCDINCLSCTGSSNNCQSCIDKTYFYLNQCYQNPLPGTYCTSYADCQQCDTNCKTCINSSKNCISCPDYQYLYSNSCQILKPSSVYCEQSQNFFTCQQCTNLNCQECQKSDLNICTSCKQSQFLYKGDCVQSQPDSTYCQDNKCQDCDISCSSCNGPSNNNCITCKAGTNRSLVGTQCLCNEGYYEDTSKTCQQCSTTCLTCSGPSDKECLTCKNYIYQNTCYDSPPSGTYCDPSTKQCNKCDQTCSACSGPNNNNCTQCDSSKRLSLTASNTCACPDNQFIDNSTGSVQCSNCNSLCKTCSGPDKNNCLSCLNYLFNNQCYDSQPPQTYCDSQKICHQCSLGCNSCQDSKTCSDCLENFFLASDNTCQQCYPNCLTCNGNNPNQCLTCQNALVLKTDKSCGCQSGYFVDSSNQSSIQCNKCDSTCLECQGSQPNQCISCNQSTANKYLYKNQCLDNKPDSTYCDPVSNICNDCDQSCSSCGGTNVDNCITCKPGLFFYNGKCLSSQPDKTYCDKSQTCKDCQSSCQACKDSPDCTACPKDQFLFNNECQTSQPSNTFCQDKDTFKVCQNCQKGCSECSSEIQCTKCQKDYFLYKNQCQVSQPDKTYCKENICVDCDVSCSQCSGPSNIDCVKCQGDFLPDSQSKICQCPPGTYNNSDENNLYKCLKCTQGCSKCQDDFSCEECTLSEQTKQKLFLLNNQCSDQQPPNTYCNPITFVCQDCQAQDNPCQQCDKTLKMCLSCQKGDFLYQNNCLPQQPNSVYCDANKICKDCDKNCLNCSETASQCIECSKGQFLYEKKCYPDQPQGTYCREIQNKNQETFLNCQICKASNCHTCNSSADKCDVCIEGSKLDSNMSSCVCPEGSYLSKEDPNKFKCTTCLKSNCSQCNKTACFKCLSGYKFNDSGDCVYCENKMYANSLGICNLPCKQGCKTCISSEKCIELDDTYKNCDVSCQTCTGPSSSECASCSSSTRLFDSINKTCKCISNFEEAGQADCQYIYQVPKPIVNAQSAVGVAQFSIVAITTVTNFIPGISYSLGLMQLLGNFYIRQDQTYSSQASVLSSYTKYNLNSLFQQKLLYPSSDNKQKTNRVLQQNSNESIYPINDSEKALMLTDKIFFASNSIITLSLIILIFLVAQAMHQYQIKTKEHFKHMNIIRWNLVIFLIQISSNFMLITLFQCQIAEQRMIDWAFIGIFIILYSFYIAYSFMRIYRNDHQDSAVSILSSGINQENKFSRFYFVIFEVRKLIYCIIITGSKQFLNYTIWSICVSQVVFIYIAYKKQIYIKKLSNNVLISSEIIFLSIVCVLGVMINISDINTQKTLATIIVVLMMLYSVITISVLIYIIVQFARRKCGRREDLIQSTELSKISAKIQLLNQNFENHQKIKWSMNPLKKKRTTESNNISSILDQSISNKQIIVQQI